MRELLNKFLGFVVEKKWFFLWFLICFFIDRVTTSIILSSGKFIESNLVALKMWSMFGYVVSEIFTILFLLLVFFYVGVFGGKLTRKIVLPAFCLIYSWMMLGNVVDLMTIRYDFMFFDLASAMNWYIYCFVLSIISTMIVWIIYRVKDR